MVNVRIGPDERDLEILAALRAAEERVSGQFLAARLGISRVALWKRIERLKRFAYRIEGDHGGYRLVEEDVLVPAAFPDARGVVYRSATASTMDEAWTLAESGAASGTLVVADRQSAGRGRQGQPWASPGGGLYLTLVLRPRLPASHAGCLALEAATGLCAWLRQARGFELAFQWPNALVAGGAKVGGLLVELAGPLEAPRFFLLGLGLYLAAADGAGLAGMMERPPLRRELAAAVRAHLSAWAEDPRPRPEAWERHAAGLGDTWVLRDWQGRDHAGRYRGFTPRGGLRLVDPHTGIETCWQPDEAQHLRRADASPNPGEPA
jgi:BirA family biotin operon repressor/biotin-[acetyl-CoA-carboxylase] ligase